ncbi:MAG: carboxymuconolactone decarboxylase family protein [Proteobacteria bacterium]|nr:carboxymuconolactone decarboxylase family protein [Pseudomonadota bacterium]
MKTTRRKKALPTPSIDAHIAKGDWNPLWNTLREWDPEFMEAYLAFRSVPHRRGSLPGKTRELIMIAINAATTHLYGPGVRRHMQNAMKLGATRDEILETIQLTTVMGIHACNLAVPILAEELAKSGAKTASRPNRKKNVSRKS